MAMTAKCGVFLVCYSYYFRSPQESLLHREFGCTFFQTWKNAGNMPKPLEMFLHKEFTSQCQAKSEVSKLKGFNLIFGGMLLLHFAFVANFELSISQ